MGSFLIFIIIMVIVAAVTIGAVWLLYKILANFQPSSNKIEKDLQKLKQEISIWVSELVPMNTEELELLSLNQINMKIRKGVATTAKGVITSIYHEPMIAWAYKKYFAGSANAILYARTSNHEFTYRIKKSGVQLRIDKQTVGELRGDGLLYSYRSNKVIAEIKQKPVDGLLPIVVGERELGSLTTTSESLKSSTRAFQLLSDDLGHEEKAVLLSLSILELVQRELPSK